MATWTDIPNASLEPGAPARSVDAIALRDNDVYLRSIMAGTETEKIVDAGLSTTVTTTGRDWVLNRNATAVVGAVGTYAFMYSLDVFDYAPGATLTGSGLRYGGVRGVSASTGKITNTTVTPSGTWRCMGFSDYDASGEYGVTLWLRIS